VNYRHIYHAGNFADVAKHVGLVYCLSALQRKDAAFFAMDSHAGRGYYDLQAAEARKSDEAERGIQRLIETRIGSAVLADYFTAVGARR
jgi:23S rRNA (adenine2030-N6)-methyltransferase